MNYTEIEWPLVVFTFFMALAGGLLAMLGYLSIRKKMSRKFQFVMLVVTLVMFAIGGIGVFMHLQHWERIFNGFGHLSSPITHEFIGVIVFIIVMAVYFLFMYRSDESKVPTWVGVVTVVCGLGMPVLSGLSYMMAADPVWNTWCLIVFYFFDAIMMGGIGTIIVAKAVKEDAVCADSALISLIGAVGRIVTVLVYAVVIYSQGGSYVDVEYYFDPTLPDTAMVDAAAYSSAILAGDLSGLFYGVVIVIGSIVPLVIAILMVLKSEKLKAFAPDGKNALVLASASLICTVAGGVMWRCMLYWVCIKAFNLCYF